MRKIGLANKKLFGMVALSMGFLTREQLKECVTLQQEATIPRRLGDIMLARGYLDAAQIRDILAIQGKTGETTSMPKTKSERRRLLGEILVETGAIDRKTLTAVLKRQQLLRRSGINPRLGEILIAIGKITRGQLKKALISQASA